MRTHTTFVALALALLVGGAAYAAGAPSDANIAAIAVTANALDVEAGNLALSKSTNPEVKKFAQLMVDDHTAVNKQAGDLAARLKLTPKDDENVANLKKGGADNIAKLKGLSGAEFDKAYVDHEVEYHKAVQDTIDKVLIPNAKNAELKGLLQKVSPVIGQHLQHAQDLQKTLTAAK